MLIFELCYSFAVVIDPRPDVADRAGDLIEVPVEILLQFEVRFAGFVAERVDRLGEFRVRVDRLGKESVYCRLLAPGFKNKSKLAAALGVSPSYLSQLATRGLLNEKFRENLRNRFPYANIDYLEFGTGEPLLPEEPETPEERRERLIEAIRDILDLLDPYT